MFDYIFYRLYRLYKIKERNSAVFTGVLYLSTLQFLLLFSIAMSIDIFIGSISETHYHVLTVLRQFSKNNVKITVVILGFLLEGINYFYYKKRYKMLIKKYKNHPLNKTFKVWYLYFVGAGLVAFPFILHKILMLIFG